MQFSEGKFAHRVKIGTIYSRFTIHSIPHQSALKVYQWAYDHLENGGYFLIEARSTKDQIYGAGQQVDDHSFFTDHYRRFLNLDETANELQSIGFEIKKTIESRGLAKHKNEDPVVVRIFAYKNN